MKVQRRRDGKVYTCEAHSWDSQLLEPIRRQWPGSYVQWESLGIPMLGEAGKVINSGPVFVLWRPEELEAPVDELEDLADLLADFTPPANGFSSAATNGHPNIAFTPEPAPVMLTSEQDGPEEPDAPLPAGDQLLRKKRAGRQAGQPKTTRYKNITRVDHLPKHTHGYMVRVSWKRKMHQKFFSDKTHGDRLAALAAAIAWRDETERKLQKPRSEMPVVGAAASNTGYVGITRTMRGKHPVFQVTWYEEGRQRRRTFNIDLLGEKQALREARKVREQAERRRLAVSNR